MKIGFVGWRGMVGNVLLQRMREECDLDGLDVTYFSTSSAGGIGPEGNALCDALNLDELTKQDVLLVCQGGDYTTAVYANLRKQGWNGYWIDAASTLRMDPSSVIVLDPVNRAVIDAALSAGGKTFVGGNCTVSLMLMALSGLFSRGLVEWISSMTYQAASGAGAAAMGELFAQTVALASRCTTGEPVVLERTLRQVVKEPDFPTSVLGGPLQFSLLPYIDKEMPNGQSKEEWKGETEANKILGNVPGLIKVDGVCVRVPALRCHSQGLTIKLKEIIPASEVENLLAEAHEWVRVVPNTKPESLRDLTPAAISGSLNVAVGRIRATTIDPTMICCFTVGDQLLWGAAEPLRRILAIIRGRL